MIDRRSLLKRFGAIGLSIPAAMVLEGHLTLPTEIQRTVAARRYLGRGYLDRVEIMTRRDPGVPGEYALADGVPVLGPPMTRVHMEAVLPDSATVEALWDARLEIRDFIIDLPFALHGAHAGGRLRIG